MQRFRLINEHLTTFKVVLSVLLTILQALLHLLNLTCCGDFEVLLLLLILLLLLLMLMLLRVVVLNGCSPVYRALL